MTRQTSITAYHRLVDGGVLSKRRAEVYSATYKNGPGTGSEICETVTGHRSTYGIGPRFTELRDMGLLRELGERKCKVTGQTVIVWDVTDRIEPLPLQKSRRSRLLSKIAEIVNEPRTYLFADPRIDPRIIKIKLLLESKGIK